MTDRVTLSFSDQGVATVVLSHPPLNIYDLAMRDALIESITAVRDNPDARSLLIRAEGSNFSAGADLNRFNHDDKAQSFEFSLAFGEAFEALTNYQGVSIAAITGFAMGGGLEVALSCDVRICEEQAQMALPEASVGLLPCGLGSQQLSWLIGEAWAKRMMLLGERIKAPQAERIGLVSEVVDTGTVLEKALELATKMTRWSPVALRLAKDAIRVAFETPLAEGLEYEKGRFMDAFKSEDGREGVLAFVEKRKPEFKGR